MKQPISIQTVRWLTAIVAVGLLGIFAPTPSMAADPIVLGVSGPLTGSNAQYGAQWKTGFDLALDQINGAGGIKGRPLQYVFEDSQSDPRQSVTIAQKFVNDPTIVAELGDFSSPASMAASPIYQRAGLVQFGFTNSHPDFTKGGDFMWSNTVNQSDEQPALAEFAVKRLGLKRLAVIHLIPIGVAPARIFSSRPQGKTAPRSWRPRASYPTRRTIARRWSAFATPSQTASSSSPITRMAR